MKFNTIALAMIFIFVITVSAVDVGIEGELGIDLIPTAAINYSLIPTVNSSEYCNFWDLLDDPSDILGSLINNDLGWITIDTNSSTECTADEFLLGNASCMNSTVLLDDTTIPDTNASTECNAGEYLDGGVWCASINSTIDDRTASIFYNATNITTYSGTLDFGDEGNITDAQDGWTYNVSEASGANPLNIIINFTGVNLVNVIRYRIDYIGGQGHEIAIGLWHCDDTMYEEEFGDITDTMGFTKLDIVVPDPSNHVCSGVVSVRFNHIQNGNPAHDFIIDQLILIEGDPAGSNIQHDGLLGRDDKENHPWAMPTNFSRNAEGSLNMTDGITYYNITQIDCMIFNSGGKICSG